MNLEKLFKLQKELDERILNRFPELRNEDLLPRKILALQVELGELAQNWRGFKFWKVNSSPCTYAEKEILVNGVVTGVDTNPLLEEYVDCLHFILSIGNDLCLNIKNYTIIPRESISILEQFSETYYVIGDLQHDPSQYDLILVLERFLALGEMLGFNWSQIEQSYYVKNAINHTRQDENY